MRNIKLIVKSEAQYTKTIAELDSLGVKGFLVVGYTDAPAYGIRVWSDNTYTDGTSSSISEGIHTKRKQFIQDVKAMLGKE